MPSNNQLRHRLEIIAGQPNQSDFIALLEAMVENVADVRINIGQNDSMEIRKAISTYLQDQVDNINRIRKNKLTKNTGSQDDAGA